MPNTLQLINSISKRIPAVIPHLKGRARWFVFSHTPLFMESNGYNWNLQEILRLSNNKTYDYYLQQLERLVTSVYNGNLGGDFIDVMANLISGQLTQAFEQAWTDEGDGGNFPDYLASPLEDMILNQYDFVDGLYRDTVDARVDETPLEPLLSRAALWANQWNAAYKEAVRLIQFEGGGNFVWRKGATENGCDTCANLDGIVLSAKEWDALGVHPQGYPNPKLECQGGGPGNNCDCTLSATDQRRTAKGFEQVLNIVSK